jgi:hypothetical protein
VWALPIKKSGFTEPVATSATTMAAELNPRAKTKIFFSRSRKRFARPCIKVAKTEIQE